MEYSLIMIFKTSTGSKFSLSIDGIREDLNDIEVNNIMDEIIKRNVIKTTKGFLISKFSSYIIEKSETPFIIS